MDESVPPLIPPYLWIVSGVGPPPPCRSPPILPHRCNDFNPYCGAVASNPAIVYFILSLASKSYTLTGPMVMTATGFSFSSDAFLSVQVLPIRTSSPTSAQRGASSRRPVAVAHRVATRTRCAPRKCFCLDGFWVVFALQLAALGVAYQCLFGRSVPVLRDSE